MGKKSLYTAIILISLSIFFFLLPPAVSPNSLDGVWGFYVIIPLPLMIGGIFLLRKHLRTKNSVTSNSQNNEQSKPSKNVEFKFQTTSEQPPSPKSEGKTQFWVCPVCGNDTKEYLGRTYCHNCDKYL